MIMKLKNENEQLKAQMAILSQQRRPSIKASVSEKYDGKPERL
jgi:hypothetical protein